MRAERPSWHSHLPGFVVVLLAVAATTISYLGDRTPPSGKTRSPISAPTLDVARLRPVHAKEFHAIDTASLGNLDVFLAGRTSPVTITNDAAVDIRGWAVDAGARRPSSSVFAIIGANIVVAQMGFRRDDVAAALNTSAYANSGFEIVIPTSALPPGPSRILLRAVTADGRGSYDLNPPIDVVKP
jgi:hypothetical protein